MAKPKAVKKVEKADRKLARRASKAGEVTALRKAADVSELADQPPVAALCVAVLALGALTRDEKLTRTGLRMGAAFVLTTLTKALVKSAVDRTRPATARQRGYAAHKGRHDEGPWNSFPSGHTANAVALASAVTREYPGAAAGGAVLAAFTGLAQLPREAHYLSDVVAGALIGAAAEAATARLFD